MKKEKTFNKSNTTTNSKQLEILKTNFPQCFDKKGDFIPRKMEEVVAKDGINLSKESYSLNWLGKSYARLLANEQPLTLLKENTEHNQKPENINSNNLLIKGDNLEVLKHLRHAYSEQVKMIYIDPPYNTGNDGFVYADDRKFTTEQLQRLAGLNEDEAQHILDFTASNSNSHSAWLTFIYPRLYIARELLSDDGVIFISIDDNEQAQLKMLCDEVFGEENLILQFATISNPRGRQTTRLPFALTHEYVFAYSKDINNVSLNYKTLEEKQRKEYKLKDESGNYRLLGLRKRGTASNKEDRPNLFYPIYFNADSKDFSTAEKEGYIAIFPKKEDRSDGVWRWQKSTVEKDKEKLFIKLVNRKNGDKEYDVFVKDYISDENGQEKGSKYKSILDDKEFNNEKGTERVKDLFNLKLFDFPKPVGLIKSLINFGSKNGFTLDFFAGSGTTADAVMQLNAEDGGNRKCISVQLGEPIDKNKNKTAYDFVKDELKQDEPTIFEITKERILRAGAKIQQDNSESKEPKDLSKQDFGFKVFETLPMFDGYFDEMDELLDENKQQTLFDGTLLSDKDLTVLLTSWMVNDGIKLTEKVEKITLNKYIGYYADKKLYLMDKGFATDDLKALLEKIDNDKNFQPNKIVLFGYNFESKHQREISEALSSYTNKKQIELDKVVRY